jgi:HEAT repeat protein
MCTLLTSVNRFRNFSVLTCIACLALTGCTLWRGYSVTSSCSVKYLTGLLSDRRTFTTEWGQESTSPSGEAAQELVRRGTNAVIAVVEVLERSTNSFAKIKAAYILGDIRDHRAVEPLIAALKDKDTGVRKAAAYALGELKDPRSVEPLIEALKDSDYGVRDRAAYALGSFPSDSRIVAPLIALLNRSSTGGIPSSLIHTLGMVHDPRVIPALVAAYKKMDWNEKREVIKVFEKRTEPQAFDALLMASRDNDAWIRGWTVRALDGGYFRDPRVVEPLVRLSKDKEKHVRDAALEVLRRRKKLGLENKLPKDNAL